MRLSIKHKLVAIISLIFIPLVLFAGHNYFTTIQHEKDHSNNNNLFIATTVAGNLDHLVDTSFSTLRALSKHPAVVNKDSLACDRLFSELLPSYPYHLNILAAGMNGFNYGSGVLSLNVRRLNYNDREWFKKARNGAGW